MTFTLYHHGSSVCAAKVRFAMVGERGNIGKETRFKGYDGVWGVRRGAPPPPTAGRKGWWWTRPMRSTRLCLMGPWGLTAWAETRWCGAARGGRGAGRAVRRRRAGLQAKYIEHLCSNIEAYPSLRRKFAVLVGTDSLKEMLAQVVVPPVKCGGARGAHRRGARPPAAQVPARRERRRRPDGALPAVPPEDVLPGFGEVRPPPARAPGGMGPPTPHHPRYNTPVRCTLDAEMLDKGLVRKYFPVFDRNGTEIPLSQVRINRGDICSVQTLLTCQLWDIGGNTGAGFKRGIKSITVLRRASEGGGDDAAKFEKSPFDGLTFE